MISSISNMSRPGQAEPITLINIVPGIVLQSGYEINEINILATKIVRACLFLFIFQSLLVIVRAARLPFALGLLLSIISIIFYGLIYHLSVLCIKHKNEVLCCRGCTPLLTYRIYLGITIFLLTLDVLVSILTIAARKNLAISIIQLIIYLIFLGVNSMAFHWSSQMTRILYSQVHLGTPVPADVEMGHPPVIATATALPVNP